MAQDKLSIEMILQEVDELVTFSKSRKAAETLKRLLREGQLDDLE